MAAKLKKEQVEAIEAQVRLGLNIHEIALATGFSLSTISKYVEVMRARRAATVRPLTETERQGRDEQIR